MIRLRVLLALALTLSGLTHAKDGPAATVSASDSDADPYAWLEDTHSSRSQDWVAAHDAATANRFMQSKEFHDTRKHIYGVIDSEVRIPYVERMGAFLYNFWQDSSHPSGVWRRTSLDEFRKPSPQWTVLIPFGSLERPTGSRWAFRGAQCLEPRYQRCLVSLSAGGSDATEVQEFDIPSKSFVDDGFNLPLAKNSVSWIDANTVYVATDFGPGTMTASSYPRIVKEWKRGTPLSSATTVYEGKTSDLQVSAWHDRTPGSERDFIDVAKDYFHNTLYLRRDGQLVPVEVPPDAAADVHREWLLVKLRLPWTVGGATWPSGSLLAARFDDFMAGRRDLAPLFTPDAHTALSSWHWTRNHLILDTLVDVQSRLEVMTPAPGAWQRKPMDAAPAMSTIDVVATDPDGSDEYWFSTTNFLTPSVLQRGDLADGTVETLKHQPASFDADQFDLSQHFAVSKDGTRVPYFQIAPRDMLSDGSRRTLLYGYGGFEASQLPYYDGSIGRSWLQRGGVYVVANIRGGGEYGPDWHQAATRAQRPRAYEDFAAVAQDLIDRRVTSPKHLGAEGASNGGLLVGNMLTGHPELFGAIACEYPLLDMKRYTHLAAGSSWLVEFGDPDTADWDFIKTFSPYQNLKPGQHYPPVLFYTTSSDDRVGPAHARKMAAKMEGMGYKDVWFYENTGGGHGAGPDDKQEGNMRALVYDFLWDELQ